MASCFQVSAPKSRIHLSFPPYLQTCPTHRLGYIYPEDESTTALRNVRNWHCHIPGDLTSETRDCTWFTLSTVCSATESVSERRGKKVFAQTEKQTYIINFICTSRFYIRRTIYFLHVNHSCETERNTASFFIDILVEKLACCLSPTLFLPPMCTSFEYLFLRRNPTYTREKIKLYPVMCMMPIIPSVKHWTSLDSLMSAELPLDVNKHTQFTTKHFRAANLGRSDLTGRMSVSSESARAHRKKLELSYSWHRCKWTSLRTNISTHFARFWVTKCYYIATRYWLDGSGIEPRR
jgi:hypothetical protein